MSGTSYRIDETYVKVGMEWNYLYRAVDSVGCTIEFMLSARREVSAAKRFFKKLMSCIAFDRLTAFPGSNQFSQRNPQKDYVGRVVAPFEGRGGTLHLLT